MSLHLDIYLPVMASVILHEIAHGYAALLLGDPTAKEMGRLTLNPVAHARAFGTVILPLGLLALTGGKFMFGWARPLPVQDHRLGNPGRDMALVCAAGPAVNALLALWCWLAFEALSITGIGPVVRPWLTTGMAINCFLTVVNLIPVKPLDGWHILNYFRGRRP